METGKPNNAKANPLPFHGRRSATKARSDGARLDEAHGAASVRASLHSGIDQWCFLPPRMLPAPASHWRVSANLMGFVCHPGKRSGLGGMIGQKPRHGVVRFPQISELLSAGGGGSWAGVRASSVVQSNLAHLAHSGHSRTSSCALRHLLLQHTHHTESFSTAHPLRDSPQ